MISSYSIYYKYVLVLFIMKSLINLSYEHGSKSAKILLISLDGFRHDYFDMSEKIGINLKNLKKIFYKGIKSDHINNLFITHTFPNHMSIITGCYEESHGIIDNNFFDPLLNESFSMKNITQNFESKWFSAVEPIWVTNQKNGYKSAVVFWPGNLAPYKNEYFPSYFFGLYNSEVTLKYKFDIMLNWLTEKETNLGIIYHPHPDLEGHKYGPNSSNLLEVLSNIDDSLGYLLKGIEKKGLEHYLNVIIVSDHGMTEISSMKRVLIDQYLSPELYYLNRQESYTMWGLWPRYNVTASDIVATLRAVPHITVYLKENMSSDWHYANNNRVAPVIVMAEDGWVLVHGDNDTVVDKGTHGYAPSSDKMRGIFVAWGPDIINSGPSPAAVQEIDVFPLIAKILGLERLPEINGSLARVRWIIKARVTDDDVFSSLIVVSVLALLCALAICIVISCAHHHAKSAHLQKCGQTYALQTGKLMRRRQNNNDQGSSWTKFGSKSKKKPKVSAADTAFLLESSSGNDDDILGDVAMGQHKVSS